MHSTCIQYFYFAVCSLALRFSARVRGSRQRRGPRGPVRGGGRRWISRQYSVNGTWKTQTALRPQRSALRVSTVVLWLVRERVFRSYGVNSM